MVNHDYCSANPNFSRDSPKLNKFSRWFVIFFNCRDAPNKLYSQVDRQKNDLKKRRAKYLQLVGCKAEDTTRSNTACLINVRGILLMIATYYGNANLWYVLLLIWLIWCPCGVPIVLSTVAMPPLSSYFVVIGRGKKSSLLLPRHCMMPNYIYLLFFYFTNNHSSSYQVIWTRYMGRWQNEIHFIGKGVVPCLVRRFSLLLILILNTPSKSGQ